MTAKVTALYRYPVKSCAGIAMQTGTINARGFAYDRAYMLIDMDGRFVSQREIPRMALVNTAFETDAEGNETALILSAEGMESYRLPLHLDGTQRTVELWKKPLLGLDQGAEIADWFSTFLQDDVRLVRMGDDYVREVHPDFTIRKDNEQAGAYADGFPFLIVSQESLEELNTRLDTPLLMNRFRPNIVVSGVEPYAEDTWRRVQIGDIVFDGVKLCARCAITTVDQATAARGKEPLRTLAKYRNQSRGVMFGQNAIHHTNGALHIGDPVTVIERQAVVFE